MKILVFSDSHGINAFMKEVAAREDPDLILHLGDYSSFGENPFAPIPWRRVKGNCDRDIVEEELFLDFGATKIWMCHGHLFGVKSGLEELFAAGRERGANVILFGHTHKAYLHKDAELTVMNPGTTYESYGILELSDGQLTKAGLFAREGGEL